MYVPPSDISRVTALVPKSSNLYLLPESFTTFTVYVFEGAVPAANQFHDTKFSVLKFIFPSEPRVNPSLSNDSILLVYSDL